MKEKITFHFYLRSKKAIATGLLPLYVRLTVDGGRLEFNSKKFIPIRWKHTSQHRNHVNA